LNLSVDKTIKESAGFLVHYCYNASEKAGWWKDSAGKDIRENPYTFSNKLMLIVSEIAEAMEADRKGLMDSHLPHRRGTEVELADAVIRIADLCGAYGLDLGAAIADKMAYNAQRPDHKLENRQAIGGKAY